MKLVFVINPSRFYYIVRGLEDDILLGNSEGVKLPRYFLEVDKSIRRSPGYRNWVAEKDLEVVLSYHIKQTQVSLILRGRPDFYDPQQGVVIEVKKQVPDERNLQWAWLQAGLYGYMLLKLGFKVQAVGVQFLWPGETEAEEVFIRGWKIPLPKSMGQTVYCDVVPFTEDDVAFQSLTGSIHTGR